MSIKLTIELVPESAWFKNVRAEVKPSVWDKIKKKCAANANHKCEICSDTGFNQGVKWAVECHEIWNYNDKSHEQTLIGFIALCPRCHKVKHPGLASMRGETHIVIQQLMKVNNMTRTEANNYLQKSFQIFDNRSQHNWKLDISYFTKYIQS